MGDDEVRYVIVDGVPRKTIRSFSRREKISKARSERGPVSMTVVDHIVDKRVTCWPTVMLVPPGVRL